VKSGLVITFKMFCAVTISQVSYAEARGTSKVFTIGLKCYTVNHIFQHHRSPYIINKQTNKSKQANKQGFAFFVENV